MRDGLHGGGARADDAHPLVAEAVEPSEGVAAGVVVVPSAGVEAVALEVLDPRDARQLGPVQRTAADHHELSAHGVAAVGADRPAGGGVIPLEPGDLGAEAGVVVEPEVLAEAPAVLLDLWSVGVLLLRDVAGLLEQRKVDVGLHVALGARVPVPVPRATEVAALLDDADVGDPRLHEPSGGDQPGEPATDQGHGDLVRERLACHDLHVGVLDVVPVPTRHLDVLVGAIVPQPLVALGPVALAQRLTVQVGALRRGHRLPLPPEPRRVERDPTDRTTPLTERSRTCAGVLEPTLDPGDRIGDDDGARSVGSMVGASPLARRWSRRSLVVRVPASATPRMNRAKTAVRAATTQPPSRYPIPIKDHRAHAAHDGKRTGGLRPHHQRRGLIGRRQTTPHLPLEGCLADRHQRGAHRRPIAPLDGGRQPGQIAGHRRPRGGRELHSPEVSQRAAHLACELVGQT